jgi:hypothetical protein
MRWWMAIPALCLGAVAGVQSCAPRPNVAQDRTERSYRSEVSLGQPLRVRPAAFRTGGFPSNEKCMRGEYTYPHETQSGPRGREAWLCCVPPRELLRDSFSCAPSAAAGLLGGEPSYLKVRYCLLYDALSPTESLMPACIAAPLRAPDDEPPACVARGTC